MSCHLLVFSSSRVDIDNGIVSTVIACFTLLGTLTVGHTYEENDLQRGTCRQNQVIFHHTEKTLFITSEMSAKNLPWMLR